MANSSQAYLEIVGGPKRGWPRSYDENGAISRPCMGCGAEPLALCVNPIRGKPRKVPCIVRVTGPWN
jgi:hypothetical protein